MYVCIFINLFAGLFWGGPDFGVSASEPGLESESDIYLLYTVHTCMKEL